MDPYGVLELTRKLGREPNVDTAVDIISWELGDLTKSWVYSKWHPDLEKAYVAEAKLALASLVFQVHVVAALLNASPAGLLEVWIEQVKDRIKEKEKKVGRFRYYEEGLKNEQGG